MHRKADDYLLPPSPSLSPSLSPVVPSRFTVPPDAEFVNGSTTIGLCPQAFVQGTVCAMPNTSVLFDGNIPTLTGLDGNMWANQLVTLHTNASSTTFIPDFSDTPEFTIVGRIEVVLFNCPQYGIGVQSITLLRGEDGSPVSDVNIPIDPLLSSCDSLVRVCLNVFSESSFSGLQFDLAENATWVHLGELTFYPSDRSPCTTDVVFPAAPTVASAVTGIGTYCCLYKHTARLNLQCLIRKHAHKVGTCSELK